MFSLEIFMFFVFFYSFDLFQFKSLFWVKPWFFIRFMVEPVFSGRPGRVKTELNT